MLFETCCVLTVELWSVECYALFVCVAPCFLYVVCCLLCVVCCCVLCVVRPSLFVVWCVFSVIDSLLSDVCFCLG